MGLLDPHERHSCRLGQADLVAGRKKEPQGTATDEVAVHASASPPYHVKGEVVDGAGVPAKAEDKPYDPAAWMHQRLVHQVMEFEKNLGPDHERPEMGAGAALQPGLDASGRGEEDERGAAADRLRTAEERQGAGCSVGRSDQLAAERCTHACEDYPTLPYLTGRMT